MARVCPARPTSRRAGEWAVKTMKEWGLVNVALEPWDNQESFPRGWTNDKFYLAAVAPDAFPMYAMSTAWTPGTNGLVRGEAMLIPALTAETAKDFAGKLKGKFVLRQAPPDAPAFWNPAAVRYTRDQLDAMEAPNRSAEFGVTAPGAAGRGAGGRGGAGGGAPGGAPAFNATSSS